MKALANFPLRVSDKAHTPWAEPAKAGSDCDWAKGEEVGSVTGMHVASVSVATKYGELFIERANVMLVEETPC